MLKHTKNGIAYTTDKNYAEQFKVEDNKPIHFIKNERVKNYLQTFGSYKRFYRKMDGYYILPPAVGFNNVMKQVSLSNTGNLHDWQIDTVQYVLDTYNAGKKSCFVVSGTGTGKGHILPTLINSMKGLRIIVLAPNDVIGQRLMDDLDMAKYVRGKKVLKSDNEIIVTLYKTFNLYIDHFKENYDVVIVDEGHHVSGQLEQSLYVRKGFICGMTATPYRNEFDNDGFKMFFGNILDTEQKALPIKVFEYKYKYEYSQEDVVKAADGISSTSQEIYRRLFIGNKDRYEHLSMIINNLDGKGFKNYIVFSDRLDHIAEIKTKLDTDFPNKTIVVIKGESDVLGIMQQLKGTDDIIIIGMTSVVKEGMNVPQLEVGILFTSAVFKGGIDQMAGRVNRFYGKKEYGYFIDFQDYINIGGTKQKPLGVYGRRKAYKEFGRPVGDLINDLLNNLL